MRSLAVLFLSVLAFCQAARNEAEEAICRPFLTSRSTSPLVPNLQRNLTVDEDGEFACELVLQDEDLPVQIRATVHEGLAWLAIRHSQMGIPRQKAAARHYQLLSELLPGSVDFAWKAGTFFLDAEVSNPELAATYLRRALYEKASQDKARTPELTYSIRKSYAQALGQTQQFAAARAELELLLKEFPYDFEAAAILSNGEHSATAAAYRTLSAHATSAYTGFNPCEHASSDLDISGATAALKAWQPQLFSRLLTAEEFLPFIQRREPFIVRMGSGRNLSQALGWSTQAWRGEAGRVYLREKVGAEQRVLVEVRPHLSSPFSEGDQAAASQQSQGVSESEGETFAFGLAVRRKTVPFAEVLETDFTSAALDESVYLNIQTANTSAAAQGEVYRTPLHLLKEDIPLPAMLRAVEGNLTEVNLWMGVARDRDSQSKLHMDATDNLYVVLEGAKHFAIASPAEAPRVKTVAPSFGVSPDGLSFQFNVRKFAAYVRYKAQMEVAVNGTNDAATTVGSAGAGDDAHKGLFSKAAIQEHLVGRDVEYDASNHHFSTIDANSADAVAHSADCSASHPAFTYFELQEGDMLYLPTGWFHQVTSRQGRHTALNYWWRALHWREAVDHERRQTEELFEKLLA